MAFDFDTDTALDRVDESTWTTRLDRRWSINVVPNGGYSTACMVRAMQEATGRPDPLSVTTHFYKPTIEDAAATVKTDVHRSGRNFANVSAVLIQDDVVRTRATAVLGSLDDPAPPGVRSPEPVELPDPADCFERDADVQGFPIPMLDMIETRIDRDIQGSGTTEFGGWLRFADGRPPDSLALGVFADALPPSILGIVPRAGWVPTLELTVHLRRRPVEGWIRAWATVTDLQGTSLVEDVLLWDDSGALVAQGRQLALLLVQPDAR